MINKSRKLILAKPSLSRTSPETSLPKGEKNIVILAIETSCDETAAAVLILRGQNLPVFSPQDSSFSEKLFLSRNKSDDKNTSYWPAIKILSSIVKSQIKLHSKMGGVVPEAAARAHVKYIRPVVEKTINNSRLTINGIDYIAVTQGPGLISSLIVGVEFTKALSFALNKPIIPVNHLAGHLYSPFSPNEGNPRLPRVPLVTFPMISLIVSGGHTILVLMKNIKEYKVLGQTVDDAAGEAFDKVAKLLGLPYPGGPAVSKLASDGNPTAINFPRPMINHNNYNFSFSGLKTAVLYYLRDYKLSFPRRRESKNLDWIPDQVRNDICASFQQAVSDVLVAKTLGAAKEFGARSISLSGGVAANISLRERLKVESKKLKVKFLPSPLSLTGDNAEMIGLAAAFMLHNGYRPKSYKIVKADPNLEL